MITAAELAALLFPPTDVGARLVVVSIVAGGYAATVADVWAGLVTAGLGFLLFTGFLVNGYGELTWDGTTSVWQVLVFAAAAGVGVGPRWIRAVAAELAWQDKVDELVARHTNEKESHGG